tara:strand:+ start:285 stop:398 length:114 start_codon:yes stop_codon:yes gene_type:complete
MKTIWKILTLPYTKYMQRKKLKARLAALRKRDPFIYK